MTLDSPQIESDDTWLTSDWVRWHLTHLRLSQMTLDSPQIESDDTWLTSDWVRWHLTHLRLSQMTLDSHQMTLDSDWVRWHLTHLRLSQMTLDSPQIESDDTWLTSDWVRWHLTHLRLSQMTLDSHQMTLDSDWVRGHLTHLRLSQMALTLRTLLGMAEPVPRNRISGYVFKSVSTSETRLWVILKLQDCIRLNKYKIKTFGDHQYFNLTLLWDYSKSNIAFVGQDNYWETTIIGGEFANTFPYHLSAVLQTVWVWLEMYPVTPACA